MAAISSLSSVRPNMDDAITNLELLFARVRASKGSAVKLPRAELDLLIQLGQIETCMHEQLDGSLAHFEEVWGAPCSLIARIEVVLKALELSDMTKDDVRKSRCERVCVAVESVLTDLGHGRALREAKKKPTTLDSLTQRLEAARAKTADAASAVRATTAIAISDVREYIEIQTGVLDGRRSEDLSCFHGCWSFLPSTPAVFRLPTGAWYHDPIRDSDDCWSTARQLTVPLTPCMVHDAAPPSPERSEAGLLVSSSGGSGQTCDESPMANFEDLCSFTISSSDVVNGVLYYTITVSTVDGDRTARKRYRDFCAWDAALQKNGDLSRSRLPSKEHVGMRRLFARKSFLEKRQKGLQSYMNTVAGQNWATKNDDFVQFFERT